MSVTYTQTAKTSDLLCENSMHQIMSIMFFVKVLSYGKTCYIVSWKLTNISEKYIAACRVTLATYFMLICCLAYSSTKMMEKAYFFKISVGFQQSTWRFIETTGIFVITGVKALYPI